MASSTAERLRKGFWLNAALLFLAMRSADALNAVTGLWLVPRGLDEGALGAVLPLTAFGAALAVPAGVLSTVFSRTLCRAAVNGDFAVVRGLLRDALGASLLFLGLALGLSAAAMPWLCRILRTPHAPAGYLAVGSGLLAAFVPLVLSALQALGKFGALSAASLLAAPARFAAMALLLPLAGLSGYFLGQTAPLAVQLAVALAVLWPLLRGNASRAWRAEAPEMARYGLRAGVGALAGAAQGMAAAFAIRHALPEADSAGYYVLSRFAEIATYCGGTLGAVLFPYAVAASERGEDSARLRNGVFFAMLGGGALLALLFLALLPPLFRLLPGCAPYAPAAPLGAYLTLAVTLNAACAAHFAHANARGDFRYLKYVVPLALGGSALYLSLPCRTLAGMLHLLFLTAAAQTLCVAADMARARRQRGRDCQA